MGGMGCHKTRTPFPRWGMKCSQKGVSGNNWTQYGSFVTGWLEERCEWVMEDGQGGNKILLPRHWWGGQKGKNPCKKAEKNRVGEKLRGGGL